MILGVTIATTFTVMVVMALPRLRAAQHDRFELTHRFCGWAALVLVWINTMLFVDGDRGDRSFGSALLTAPAFWLVVLSAVLAGWPWLLTEDLVDAPGANDPDAIVRAKAAVERAVAGDGPALVALGVPRMARPGPLAEWPEVLVHGALGRPNAVLTDRGVVLTEWRQASLGCGLTDIVRLARDAGAPARPLAELYAREAGRPLTDEALRTAEELL